MAKNTIKKNKGKQASLKTSKAKPTTGKKPSAKSRKRAASDVSGSNDSSPAPKKIKKSHRSHRKAESEEVTEPEESDSSAEIVDGTDSGNTDDDDEVSQMPINEIKYRLTVTRMTFRNNIPHPFQQRCLSKKTQVKTYCF
jgi:hypothetical protein